MVGNSSELSRSRRETVGHRPPGQVQAGVLSHCLAIASHRGKRMIGGRRRELECVAVTLPRLLLAPRVVAPRRRRECHGRRGSASGRASIGSGSTPADLRLRTDPTVRVHGNVRRKVDSPPSIGIRYINGLERRSPSRQDPRPRNRRRASWSPSRVRPRFRSEGQPGAAWAEPASHCGAGESAC